MTFIQDTAQDVYHEEDHERFAVPVITFMACRLLRLVLLKA